VGMMTTMAGDHHVVALIQEVVPREVAQEVVVLLEEAWAVLEVDLVDAVDQGVEVQVVVVDLEVVVWVWDPGVDVVDPGEALVEVVWDSRPRGNLVLTTLKPLSATLSPRN